jgi:hypothetical protein
MNRQRPDLLAQSILFTLTRKVQRFRLVHAWLLVALGVALIGAVVCLDWWLPRWPVCVLGVLLVIDALLHTWINRAYSEGEVRAWQQVLGLADQVMHHARIEAAIKVTPPNPARKFLYGPRPRLRVVRPDEEPPKKG